MRFADVGSVVVDTSIWVDYLGGKRPPALLTALTAGTALLPPLVVAELISGARSVAERREIGELLQDVPMIETTLEHWLHVGDLRRSLKTRGLNVTIPDAHIAQCAIEQSAILLTRDRVFTRIAAHTWLRVGA